MSEFVEQQTLAKKYGKFIQFSTMFVHQFQGTVARSFEAALRRVSTFLNDWSCSPTFARPVDCKF